MEEILNNLKAFKNERSHLLARLNETKRCRKKIEFYESRYEIDDYEELMETVSALTEDFEIYIKSIDDEIIKIEKGVDKLKSLKSQEAKQPLQTYMLEDTNLSRKNIIESKYIYTTVMKSLKSLQRTLEDIDSD